MMLFPLILNSSANSSRSTTTKEILENRGSTLGRLVDSPHLGPPGKDALRNDWSPSLVREEELEEVTSIRSDQEWKDNHQDEHVVSRQRPTVCVT